MKWMTHSVHCPLWLFYVRVDSAGQMGLEGNKRSLLKSIILAALKDRVARSYLLPGGFLP